MTNQGVGGDGGKRYRTIVADPPWPFKWDGRAGGRRRRDTVLGYETMSVPDIAALFDASQWASDATLLLWVTRDALHSGGAREVALAWGFTQPVGEFIWAKPNFGTGAFPRSGHETCVIYRRGKGSLRPDAPRNIHSVQPWTQPYSAEAGKTHSAKPDAFLDLVEIGFEPPYLELFARRARFGWDYWGDESLGTAQMPAEALQG
ncbi:MAG TPA: MT-A70 family methyltransferase [Solirubrobacterales bacterium]|nr:MT-A70 family methyltransferase [Solirubrobacterales bacterium]